MVSRYVRRLRREQGFLTWLIPILTQEEWFAIRKFTKYGVPPNHRTLERIAKGDHLVFYLSKLKGEDLGGNFVGAYLVVSEWMKERWPMLPGDKQGSIKFPYRIKIELVKEGLTNFWKLAPKLSFVGFKNNPSHYLRGTPANLNRPLPPSDYQLILDNLS